MFSSGSLKLDLLGDGDAVLGDGGGAEFLVDDDVPALRTEGDLHGLGELIDTALQCRARVDVEMEFFGCHGRNLYSELSNSKRE